jgi:ribosomal protein L40E
MPESEVVIEEVFLGVMDIQEAKNHQYKLKSQGVALTLKSNGETCTTGCKVTVELWGLEKDTETLKQHFSSDYMKHVAGHVPNYEHMSAVYDPTMAEVICQACGAKFKPTATECPDCGLCY